MSSRTLSRSPSYSSSTTHLPLERLNSLPTIYRDGNIPPRVPDTRLPDTYTELYDNYCEDAPDTILARADLPPTISARDWRRHFEPVPKYLLQPQNENCPVPIPNESYIEALRNQGIPTRYNNLNTFPLNLNLKTSKPAYLDNVIPGRPLGEQPLIRGYRKKQPKFCDDLQNPWNWEHPAKWPMFRLWNECNNPAVASSYGSSGSGSNSYGSGSNSSGSVSNSSVSGSSYIPGFFCQSQISRRSRKSKSRKSRKSRKSKFRKSRKSQNL